MRSGGVVLLLMVCAAAARPIDGFSSARGLFMGVVRERRPGESGRGRVVMVRARRGERGGDLVFFQAERRVLWE